MKSTRNKFIMPRCVAEQLMEIKDEVAQFRIITAILKFEFHNVSPKLEGEELALFNSMTAEIKKWRTGVRRG